MPHPLFRCSLALLALPATSLLHAQTPLAMDAEQGWSAVGRCASLSNERARHDCLDDVLRRAGLLTPQAEASERRRQFGAASASPPVPEQKPAEVDRLEVTIATIGRGTDGKLVLTTVDGAVWKQTDADTIPRLPGAGEKVRIRKASLGSFLCELPSHHTFRCLRSK